MPETEEGKEAKEQERVDRRRIKATYKRDSAIASIRSIHSLSVKASINSEVVPKFLVAARNLNSLWTQFETEDNLVLDCMVSLGTYAKYSELLPTEIRGLVDDSISVAEALTPPKKPDAVPPVIQRSSRLPEIPLPSFDGELSGWPVFRDRFTVRVVNSTELSNIERFYYLLGCLTGEALHAVRNIPVSESTYDLAWSTLVERFDKPRQLATIIVDKLITAPVHSQESVENLKDFISLFSDHVSVLKSLNIPRLGEFLLFALSARCLPLFTRKAFEETNNTEFPEFSDIAAYVKARVSLLEAVNCSNVPKYPTHTVSQSKPVTARLGSKSSKVSLLSSKTESSASSKCLFCSGNHTSVTCSEFSKMSLDDRYDVARKTKICFRCLNSTHWSSHCKAAKPCTKCSGRHHTLLHPVSKPSSSSDSTSVVTASTTSSITSSLNKTTVLLGTALVHVRDRAGYMQSVRVLIDSASQISAMSTACVDRLGLKSSKWTAPITGLSGVSIPAVSGKVDCYMTPRHTTDPSFLLAAWVMPNIVSDMPSQHLPKLIKDKYSHLALADPHFDRSASIDMLLGADVFARIMDGKRVSIGDSLPVAYGSVFGWVLIGELPVQQYHCHATVALSVSLEGLVQRFWQIEEPDEAPTTFTCDGQCESIYTSECRRDNLGRFLVPLPFIPKHRNETFPGSRNIAERRFQNLERKLQNDDVLYTAYKHFMSEYETLGHMSIATEPGAYFIPHHPVFKPNCPSSKIRVVFDGSAKAASLLSLNQCLYAGPKLQLDIVDILFRFRVHQFVFTADVCKMYRQILVLPEYRRFQHILWRPSPLDELKEYQLNTVTYGINSAPFLALRVLKDIADNDCAGFPEVQLGLREQTYVDDICLGADTEDELLTLQSNLCSVLKRAGLELKKWSSNTVPVLEAVSPEDRVMESLSFDEAVCETTKVLGLQWDPAKDIFKFDGHSTTAIVTKRAILSTVARIFDPIGFLAPVTFYAKHILHEIWEEELAWDDPLPPRLCQNWKTFTDELPVLSAIKIPRYLSTQRQSHVEVCGFCDASERGFAAVVYLRVTVSDDDVSVFLLGSKTKMAPMKTVSIPRLELCASVLLARWMARILKMFDGKLTINGLYAWSDSQVALAWLMNSHVSFKVFISNRVHQVHQLISSCHWLYVRSAENPADCASRGILPSELLVHALYWSGPTFLKNPIETWSTLVPSVPVEQLPEFKPVSLAVQVTSNKEWFCRFSSFRNMIKVVAWMRRFIGLCKKRSYSNNFLSREEINQSLMVIVQSSQQRWFPELILDLSRGRCAAHPFSSLRPFLNLQNVVCVGGRILHSDLADAEKHPMLLSKDSHLSLLIARHWHLVTCHSGPRVITSLIIRQFWILSMRSVIRKVIGQCTTCVRAIAQSPHPVMSNLPSSRVQACRPFSKVGVDYAGPLPMRESKLRKPRQFKIYVSVFVCMVTKAVHLEIVTELSTAAFLAGFDRFVARRGLPTDVYSDCGTNFKGASKYLFEVINDPANHHLLSSHSFCTWHFNPPAAPHFGGLWEAAVRSFKRLLVRTVGDHTLTMEEMSTLLCRIEAVLNSRPLTPMTASPLDLDYLSPGHFLIGQPLLAVPDLNIPEGRSNLLTRWKLLHQCHQSFWRRWSTEYLVSLQVRVKWTTDVPNINVGQMVVIKDNQSPPSSWRLGRILEVNPGQDGVIRVAKILTSTGELTRPVVKLVLLPMD